MKDKIKKILYKILKLFSFTANYLLVFYSIFVIYNFSMVKGFFVLAIHFALEITSIRINVARLVKNAESEKIIKIVRKEVIK